MARTAFAISFEILPIPVSFFFLGHEAYNTPAFLSSRIVKT